MVVMLGPIPGTIIIICILVDNKTKSNDHRRCALGSTWSRRDDSKNITKMSSCTLLSWRRWNDPHPHVKQVDRSDVIRSSAIRHPPTAIALGSGDSQEIGTHRPSCNMNLPVPTRRCRSSTLKEASCRTRATRNRRQEDLPPVQAIRHSSEGVAPMMIAHMRMS
jgi:hypothetical protein